jgi:hypothetical protein
VFSDFHDKFPQHFDIRRQLTPAKSSHPPERIHPLFPPLLTFSPLSLQASGVTVADVCKVTYEEIKKDKKHRYVIFYIRDEKQIDVEVIGDRNAEYDQFLDDIQKGG